MTSSLPPPSRTGVRIAGDQFQWLVAWHGCVDALRDERDSASNPVVAVGVEVDEAGNLDDVVLFRREPPHAYKQVKYAVDSSTPVNTPWLTAPSPMGGPSILRKIAASWRRLTESGEPVELALVSNRAPDPADVLIAGRDARTGLLLPRAEGSSKSKRGRARAFWAREAGISDQELIELLGVLRFDIARDPFHLHETVSLTMRAAGLREDPQGIAVGVGWIAEKVRDGQRVLRLNEIHDAVTSLKLLAIPAQTRPGAARRWLTVLPEPPGGLMSRPPEMATLRRALLTGHGRPVVVAGMGGSGKSVIAAQVARAVKDGSDPELAAAFVDGVAWVTVGQDRLVTMAQADLVQAFGGDQPVPDEDWRARRARLQRMAEGRRGLLVLDDVWTRERCEAFRLDVPGVQVLITSRNQELAGELGCAQVLVGKLGRAQARELLALLTDIPAGGQPGAADQVLGEVGDLALGVALIGGIVRQRGPRAWPDLLRRLRARRLDEIACQSPDGYAHATLRRAVEVAVEDLDMADQRRWAELAVFAGQGGVPESAMAALWRKFDADDLAAAERISRFLARSLVQRLSDGRYQLHDLQDDVALLRLDDGLAAAHGRLLDAYAEQVATLSGLPTQAGWAELAAALARLPGSDTAAVCGYLFDHLAWHLHSAGSEAELHSLLTDVGWIQIRLIRGQMVGLVADYGFTEHDHLAQQILRALRLSAPAVTRDARLARGQLVARLSGHPDPEIRNWVASTASRRGSPEPWLMPLTPALTPVTGALEQAFTGHRGVVAAVAVTPDGKMVVSGGYDGSVRIWDLASASEIRTLEGIGPVRSIAVIPGGSIAIGGDDGSVQVWNPETGSLHRLRVGGDGKVNVLAVTPDGGTLLAAEEPGGVPVWKLEPDSAAEVLTGTVPRSLALTPDGICAIVGGRDAAVTAWSVDTRRQLWNSPGHSASVRSVAVSPDGRRVVTGGIDGAMVWDRSTGMPERILQNRWPVQAVAITPSGRIITGGTDGSIRIWGERGAEEQIRGPLLGTGRVMSMAVTPDGTRLVTSGDNDGSVRVWNLAAGSASQPGATRFEERRALAVTRDGKILSGMGDGSVESWDPRSRVRRRIRPACSCQIEVMAAAPDGERVITGSFAGHVRLRHLDTGESLWTRDVHKSEIVAAAVTSDGKHAVTASADKTVCVWEMATGELERTWSPHLLPVTSLAITPDGKQIFSAGQDMSIWISDLDTGTQQHALTRQTTDQHVTISPDGSHIVSAGFGGYGSGASVHIWDRATKTQLFEIDGHIGAVNSIAISGDSNYLVTAGADAFLHVWELRTGEKVATWHGDYPIRCCAVLPGQGLQLAVLEKHGLPYALELRTPSPPRVPAEPLSSRESA